jgi:pSer/pThr/pTyr-binding forkhead associated (FHA) protein
MHCMACGRESPEGSHFCVECGVAFAQARMGGSTTVILRGGAELTFDEESSEVSADVQAAAVASLPAGSAVLLIKRGPYVGDRFLLDRDSTTVGRHPGCDIFLDDITVSRRHVEFKRAGGVFSVRDMGSLNGTYVNRKPVDVASLASGDEVQIGKFRFIYLTGSPTRNSAAG